MPFKPLLNSYQNITVMVWLLQVNVEDGTRIIKIYKEYMSKTCILDDFEFYETRQKMIRDKKIKQKKQAGTHTLLFKPCFI